MASPTQQTGEPSQTRIVHADIARGCGACHLSCHLSCGGQSIPNRAEPSLRRS